MTAQTVSWLSAGVADVATDDAWLDEELARRLSRMPYAKRYSESRLGRWTAKRAIALSMGLPDDPQSLRTIVVSNAYDGAPVAHVDGQAIDGVIAMTDRADWAVCALVRGSMRVGCDLELVEPRSDAFVSDYFTPAEQRIVADSAEPHVIANTIWSAKESALKVLRTGLRRDTRTVEVDLERTAAASWQPLHVREITGRVFPGWWIRHNGFVLTCTSEQPTPPPASLEDPPGLATAVPSHAWMDRMRR